MKIFVTNLNFVPKPRENQFFLAVLLNLFKKISKNSDENKMTSRNLAIVFQPNFFQMSKYSKVAHDDFTLLSHDNESFLYDILEREDWGAAE